MSCKSSCGFGKCFFGGAIAAALYVGVAMIVGTYFWMDLYKDVWSAEEFAHLWRVQDAKEWSLMPYAYIFQAVIFVIGYCKFAYGMKCPLGTKIGGGAMFGIYLWLASSVLGGYWTYISQPVSIDIPMIMIKEGLVTNIVGGALVALVLTRGSDKSSCGSGNCGSK